MSQTQFVGAVSTAVSLLLLLVIDRLVWTHRRDSFRDQLFALRDKMFLYALDEKLLDAVAHYNLRLLMNGLIRYAHRVSFGRLILLDLGRRAFGLNLNTPRIYADWLDAVSQLPADQAQRLRDFHGMAMLLMMEHMISGSPVLWVGYVLVAIKRLFFRSTQLILGGVAKSLQRRVPSLDLLEEDALRTM